MNRRIGIILGVGLIAVLGAVIYVINQRPEAAEIAGCGPKPAGESGANIFQISPSTVSVGENFQLSLTIGDGYQHAGFLYENTSPEAATSDNQLPDGSFPYIVSGPDYRVKVLKDQSTNISSDDLVPSGEGVLIETPGYDWYALGGGFFGSANLPGRTYTGVHQLLSTKTGWYKVTANYGESGLSNDITKYICFVAEVVEPAVAPNISFTPFETDILQIEPDVFADDVVRFAATFDQDGTVKATATGGELTTKYDSSSPEIIEALANETYLWDVKPTSSGEVSLSLTISNENGEDTDELSQSVVIIEPEPSTPEVTGPVTEVTPEPTPLAQKPVISLSAESSETLVLGKGESTRFTFVSDQAGTASIEIFNGSLFHASNDSASELVKVAENETIYWDIVPIKSGNVGVVAKVVNDNGSTSARAEQVVEIPEPIVTKSETSSSSTSTLPSSGTTATKKSKAVPGNTPAPVKSTISQQSQNTSQTESTNTEAGVDPGENVTLSIVDAPANEQVEVLIGEEETLLTTLVTTGESNQKVEVTVPKDTESGTVPITLRSQDWDSDLEFPIEVAGAKSTQFQPLIVYGGIALIAIVLGYIALFMQAPKAGGLPLNESTGGENTEAEAPDSSPEPKDPEE